MASRALDASDADTACSDAARVRVAFNREVAEGDTPDDVVREILSDGETEASICSSRLEVAAPRVRRSAGGLGRGTLDDVVDAEGHPWRACATGNARRTIVVAVPIAAHRAVVRALSRGMVGVVLVALWLAVRGALCAPIRDLTALVAWTGRIVDAEGGAQPPQASRVKIAKLESAFARLVRRLLDALARERANIAHGAKARSSGSRWSTTVQESTRGPGCECSTATGAAAPRVTDAAWASHWSGPWRSVTLGEPRRDRLRADSASRSR